MRSKTLIVILGIAVSACGGATGRSDGGGIRLDMSSGKLDLTMGGGGGDGGMVMDECSEQAKLVYIVDSNNKLSSFKPDTLKITDIGTLNCPAPFGATPFSMAVDRDATAWVLYSSGDVYKVDTMTAKCTATGFQKNQQGFEVFGMGFVANSKGSKDETLFIAGGALDDVGTSSTLGTINMSTLQVTKLQQVSGSPELTGTGDAQLYGFFPDQFNPRVAEMDKQTGASIKTFTMPKLAGQAAAWAFAFWGGDFWIFLQRQGETSTVVYRLVPGTGAVTTALTPMGRTIVGAGVSTCAPTIIG